MNNPVNARSTQGRPYQVRLQTEQPRCLFDMSSPDWISVASGRRAVTLTFEAFIRLSCCGGRCDGMIGFV